jgi:two-component system nitrate/nitrite response regulator NarL
MARWDVLLVPASTAACAEGIAAVVDGRVGVVLTDDEADLVPVALAAADAGFAVVSQRVVAAAAGMPPLSLRDRAVLRLVGDGRSNRAVAAELGTTIGSIRAAVARLSRSLDVDGRAGLVERARSLGL